MNPSELHTIPASGQRSGSSGRRCDACGCALRRGQPQEVTRCDPCSGPRTPSHHVRATPEGHCHDCGIKLNPRNEGALCATCAAWSPGTAMRILTPKPRRVGRTPTLCECGQPRHREAAHCRACRTRISRERREAQMRCACGAKLCDPRATRCRACKDAAQRPGGALSQKCRCGSAKQRGQYLCDECRGAAAA